MPRPAALGSGCDFVVVATIIREALGAIGEARKTGFNPTFIGPSASFTELIRKLGGPAMNGFVLRMTAQVPYLDEASQPIHWATGVGRLRQADVGRFRA